MKYFLKKISCFVLGHKWGVPNQYHSPIYYRVCEKCKKEDYFLK
jgi:hypothetical protein